MPGIAPEVLRCRNEVRWRRHGYRRNLHRIACLIPLLFCCRGWSDERVARGRAECDFEMSVPTIRVKEDGWIPCFLSSSFCSGGTDESFLVSQGRRSRVDVSIDGELIRVGGEASDGSRVDLEVRDSVVRLRHPAPVGSVERSDYVSWGGLVVRGDGGRSLCFLIGWFEKAGRGARWIEVKGVLSLSKVGGEGADSQRPPGALATSLLVPAEVAVVGDSDGPRADGFGRWFGRRRVDFLSGGAVEVDFFEGVPHGCSRLVDASGRLMEIDVYRQGSIMSSVVTGDGGLKYVAFQGLESSARIVSYNSEGMLQFFGSGGHARQSRWALRVDEEYGAVLEIRDEISQFHKFQLAPSYEFVGSVEVR